MRITSFNVNGIRSLHGKSKSGEKGCVVQENCLNKLVSEQAIDVLCLQEIRCQDKKELDTYKTVLPYVYTNHSTVRKGYSGVAILSRKEAVSVSMDFARVSESVPEDKKELDMFKEGRLITAEYDTYFVVNVYTPNSKDALARLGERLVWDICFRIYLAFLRKTGKSVIVCGDLNCAKDEIDMYDPKTHRRTAGFSDEERSSFSKLLDAVGLVDSYRLKNPGVIKYSFWSNFFKSREKNRGWRIDYVLVSNDLQEKIVNAEILNEYFGSDHCPVVASIALEASSVSVSASL
jgi:exodeoxyribonuclease-3